MLLLKHLSGVMGIVQDTCGWVERCSGDRSQLYHSPLLFFGPKEPVCQSTVVSHKQMGERLSEHSPSKRVPVGGLYEATIYKQATGVQSSALFHRCMHCW